jgi:hypothetical protein
VPTSEHAPPDFHGLHIFYFGPFRFESEIDIVQLHGSRGSGQNTVSIRLAKTPASIDGASSLRDGVQVTIDEVLLHIPDVARFHILQGRKVCVEIAPGASLSDVCSYLLGSVFGALCHQNGFLPLHASSVEHRGEVTAFLGDSGAGKSTLAASLRRRGHLVISDDICLLQSDGEDARVVPLAPWLKLWTQSLDHLGETPDVRNRVFLDEEKYRVPLPAPEIKLASLARVVFLKRSTDPTAQPSLRSLNSVEAIAGLIDMTYVGWIPEIAGQQALLFRRCANLIKNVEAFELTAPWGLEHLESVLDLVEGSLLSVSR